ncbi:hypothetical protein JOD54_004178 [Actinokineospora baliensis]|uniref:nucleotidyltransferase family protein n=1 Tax=Actinokineospora baliensis TaxID=547056 RepID=UPI00195EC858|nr:nucleotidyltransferase family protein [Actinokineospora baliensis]MBM7773974.1 hypothetical protein [Actinokineospora baliensis]
MTDDLRHLADPVQVQQLRDSLAHNYLLMTVLTRARDMALPGWFLTAGCVFQNIWNHVAGYPANHGVRDYDLFYFDDSDCPGMQSSAPHALHCGQSRTWTVYAPHGIEDAFTMVVRPNPAVAPRQVYVDETTRWQQVWPSLTVHPWPSHTRTVGGTP